MSHRVTLSINQKDASVTSVVEAEIPDNEWDILQSFHQFSQEIMSTKFVQEGMPSSLRIKATNDGQYLFKAQLPNWDDVIIFLHYLRPIYLQNEAANFHTACNIIARRPANDQLRSMIDVQKDLYSGKLLQTAVRISIDGTVVNSDDVLSKWLNSYEYHRDPDKRRFIDTINQMLPLDASKVLFIQLLAEKVKAITSIASLTAVILGITNNADMPPPSL